MDLLSLVLARLKRHRAGAAIVFEGPSAHLRAAPPPPSRNKRTIVNEVIENFEDRDRGRPIERRPHHMKRA
jgi:hypothetical protein